MERKNHILMRLVSLAIILAFCLPLWGDPAGKKVGKDDFWAPDKHQHFVGSFIHTVFWGKILQQHLGQSRPQAQWIGGGVTISLGIVKEIRDSRKQNNHFCWKDLLADALGVAAGVIVLNQP